MPKYLKTKMKIHNFDKYWSITSITNSSGSALGTYKYDPYGIMLNSSTNLGNFAFTGQEIDMETSLYHFPARYYEPYWGRFLTSDPWTNLPDDAKSMAYQSFTIRTPSYYEFAGRPGYSSRPWQLHSYVAIALNAQVFNHYAYVTDNPATYVDPVGLCPLFPLYDDWAECMWNCLGMNEFANFWINIAWEDSKWRIGTIITESARQFHLGCKGLNWSKTFNKITKIGVKSMKMFSFLTTLTEIWACAISCAADLTYAMQNPDYEPLFFER